MTDSDGELTEYDLWAMWPDAPRFRNRKPGQGWFPNPLADAPAVPADAPAAEPAAATPAPEPEPAEEPEPLEVLEGRITSMAARLAAETREWLVAEFDRRKGWVQWGMRSMAHWLSWSCSVGPGAAREYVRVATVLTGLPLIGEAFGAGELSYSKVRAVSRVADRVDEGTLLEQARVHSAAQLERVVRGYRQVDAVDRPVAQRRRARWFFDEDGMLVFSARLTADEGALLVAALEQARTAVVKDVDTADPEPDPEPGSVVHGEGGCPGGVAARVELPGDADALVALAQIVLAAGPVDSSGDDRHLLVVHADADVLTADPAADQGAVCRIEHGPGLTVGQLRRLACDAAVVAWVSSVTRPGEDLRLGRKTRKISAGLRRALRFRDGGCRFPGCPRKRFLDAHHVVHWADGGPTDLGNLLLLCQRHHTAVHEDGFTLHPDPQQPGRPGRWVFHRPDGTPVPQVPDPPAPAPADVSAETPVPTPDPDPDSLRPKQHGERFSLRDSLDVLCTNPKSEAA